jgi:tetratricopeptide (TPR) repeat protein
MLGGKTPHIQNVAVGGVPQLEASHISTVNFVRSHLNVSNEFLATAIAAVEQTPALQAVNKLDPVAARDTLQFIDAFRPVLDKVSAFANALKFTIACRVSRKLEMPLQESYTLAAMGELALWQNDLAEAQRLHRTASEMRRKANDKVTVAQSQAMIANLDLEAGKPAEREAQARATIAVLSAENAAEEEAIAQEVLARIELARGKTADAEQALKRARELTKSSHTLGLLSAIAASEARVLIVQGRFEPAAKRAGEAVAVAEKSHVLVNARSATRPRHGGNAPGSHRRGPRAPRERGAARGRAWTAVDREKSSVVPPAFLYSFGFSILLCVSLTTIIAAEPYHRVRSGTNTPAATAGSRMTSFSASSIVATLKM